MLVRASFIAALLFALNAEASAADSVNTSADDLFADIKNPGTEPKREIGASELFTREAIVRPILPTEQPMPPAIVPSAKSASSQNASPTKRVDESGLRYFASQNQQKRVEKEIQRLKALYPDWIPPDDLFLGAPGGPDEQPFWDLFAVDKLDELRAKIADRMKEEPGWKPSPALTYKVDRKESRNKLIAAYELKDWKKVIEVAARDPKIMVCADIDVPWRVAEAFAESGQKAQTFEVYRFILANCRDKQLRLTTLKKSFAYFQPDDIDVLVAMGARNVDGSLEFDPIRLDLLRIRFGRIAQGKTGNKVQPADLTFLEEQARLNQYSADASLVGWYRFAQKDWDQASSWFKQAMAWPVQKRDDGTAMEEPAKMAEGYILSLKGQGKFEEAEAVAFQWREKNETIRGLFVDIFGDALLRSPKETEFAQDRMERYELLVSSTKSVFGTQAIGWYHFNRSRWDEAGRWLGSSIEWSETGKQDEKTAEGLAISLRNAFRFDDAEEVAYSWHSRLKSMRDLYIDIFAESLVRQSAPIAFSKIRIDRYAGIITADRSRIGAQGLAWYHYDRKQWDDAAHWFKTAIEWSPDSRSEDKLAEGLAQSLRGAERYQEAEDVAYEWRDRSAVMKALFLDITAEDLVNMPVAEVYPPLRLNRYAAIVHAEKSSLGAQAIAWHLYDRKTYVESVRWFKSAFDYKPDEDRLTKTVEGYVLSLRYLGSIADAEAFAFDWRERSDSMRTIYFEIAAEVITTLKPPAQYPADRMARFHDLTLAARSSFGAQAIGWYHQQRENYPESSRWFNQSLEWGGDATDPKTAQGFLLALISLGNMDEADRLAFAWHERSEEFRNLYIDVFGGAILRATPPAEFPAEMLRRFAHISGTARSVFGSQAVGWYYYDRQDWAEAARWFQASLDWSGLGNHDQKTVEGFAQSLRYIGRREEAEDILYAWRDKNKLLRKLYVEIFSEALVSTSAPVFFSDERLNRYAKLILDDKDWFGAQGLAWYRHDRRSWPDAVRWFKYAREWSKEAKGDAKMAEGLAFSLRNLELYDESEFVSVEWKDKSPAMRKLYSETVGEFLVRMKPEHTYPDNRMERYLETVTVDLNNIGAQSAAWYYYARDMYDTAAPWFLTSLQWGPDYVRDPKTAEGYITSLRLSGKLLDAEAAAFEWQDKSDSLRVLYFDLAGEVISSLKPPAVFPGNRLAGFADQVIEARSVSGAQSIAWYHQNREQWREASFWFERSLEWGGEIQDVKGAEGYLVALIGLGRLEDAEALAVAWRDRSDKVATLYIDVFGGTLLKHPPSSRFPEERLDRYAVIVGNERSVFGAQALAWYQYDRKNWEEAVRWFQASLDWSPLEKRDAKAVEGFAQSLRYVGRRDEAENVLYSWRDVNPTLHRLYVEIFAEALVNQSAPVAFEDDRINRYAEVVLADRSSFGSQGLAWYRYNRRSWPDAARWFKNARTWSADGKGDAKMAEGLAFALRNMDLYDESESVSWEWRDKSPPVRKLYTETVAEFIVRLLPSATYPVDRLSRYQIVVAADKSSIGAQAAGWYYHARDRYGEAVPWFGNALDWGPDPIRDPKTAEGLAISLRNGGNVDDAEAFAFSWRDRSDRLKEMYYEFAAQAMARIPVGQVYPADRMTRFVSMSNAARSPFGAQAIGWYRAQRKEWAEAAKWFKQSLDWTGDEKDAKTIEGYALTLRNLGRLDEAEILALVWKDRNEGMVGLYLETVMEMLSKLPATDSYPADRLEKFAQVVTERQSAAGAQAIAWYKLDRKELLEGDKWFRQAIAWSGESTDVKLWEGMAVALSRQSKHDESEAISFEWREKSDTMRELYRTTFIDKMVNLKPPANVAPDRMKNFVDLVKATRNAPGALALGWYRYDRKDWAGALEWFKASVDWEQNKKDSKGAEGYVLTLKNLGKVEEAEAFAYEWRDSGDSMRALYIDSVPELLGKLGPTGTFPADRLNRFAAQTTAAKSAYGAQALAWYRYERKDYAQAIAWFKSAMDWSGDAKDPKTAEGYALALRGASRFEDAERVAFEWRDRADSLRALYIETFSESLTRANPPPPFAPDRLARFAALVSADKSATGAQALGWYSHNIKQFRPARAWFDKSMQWGPTEGSALGLALSARSMNDRLGYDMIVNTHRANYPRLLEMLAPQQRVSTGDPGTQTLATTTQPGSLVEFETAAPARTVRIVRTERPAAQRAANTTSEVAATSSGACSTTGGDAVARGWCFLNRNRPQEAILAFNQNTSSNAGKQEEAAYGKSLALLRAGETDGAAIASDQAPMSQKRRTDVAMQVLGQRVVAAYRAGRYMEALRHLDERGAYGPETRDLAMMRGWALYHIGRKDAAKRIFVELDRQLSTNDSQNAIAVVSASADSRFP